MEPRDVPTAAAARDEAAPLAPPADTLVPVSGSGLNTGVRDALLVVDRSELVFVLGKYAVVQNMQTQELAFVAGQASGGNSNSNSNSNAHVPDLGEITAMAICGKRHYLAICRAAITGSEMRDHGSTRRASSVAEIAGSGGTSSATVSIFSLKAGATQKRSDNVKTTTTNTTKTSPRHRGASGQEAAFSAAPSVAIATRGKLLRRLSYETDRFACAALSADGKLLCGQCTNASATLVVWDWLRERRVAHVDVHYRVSRVRFNLVDMAQLSTSGGTQLKLWTLSEYTLKCFAAFKSGDDSMPMATTAATGSPSPAVPRGQRPQNSTQHTLVPLRSSQRVAGYADHVWLPDDVLLALLDDGSVQLIVNGELLQTVQALAGTRNASAFFPSSAPSPTAECMVSLGNGEGAIIGGAHGALALLRVNAKVMRAGEKEMHLQRRLHVPRTSRIFALSLDAAATTLLCCTETGYGAYDLSNLSLLLADDEALILTPMASTPFSLRLEALTAAAKRASFAALAHSPSGDSAIHIWNQHDAHECFVSHVLDDAASPVSMDLHPSGDELMIAFPSHVAIFWVLQDSLRVAFELPIKQALHVRYSMSGSHALVSTVYQVLLYRTCSRHHREPELVGIYTCSNSASDSGPSRREPGEGDTGAICRVEWSGDDNSFFVTVEVTTTSTSMPTAGAATRQNQHKQQLLRRCVLQMTDNATALRDVDECILVHSETPLVPPGHSFTVQTIAACQHSSNHDFAVFAIEQIDTTTSNFGQSLGQLGESIDSCFLRAWLQGDLTREALLVVGQDPRDVSKTFTRMRLRICQGERVTTLCSGRETVLLAGTSHGAVLLLSWRVGRSQDEGTTSIAGKRRRIIIHSDAVRRVELHCAPISGIFFAANSQLVLTTSLAGSVLVCHLHRGGRNTVQNRMTKSHDIRGIHETEFNSSNDPTSNGENDELDYTHFRGEPEIPLSRFVSVSSHDDVALCDRNVLAQRHLRSLDVDAERSQLSLENEMLHKQIASLKTQSSEQRQLEVTRIQKQAEQRQRSLRAELEAQLRDEQRASAHGVTQLTADAQLAQEAYMARIERIQTECDGLRRQLIEAQQQVQDLRFAADEREADVRREYAITLSQVQREGQERAHELEAELANARRTLTEVIGQQDQDQEAQLALLAASLKNEQENLAQRMSDAQGKMAARNQEIIMLLGALQSKDHALQEQQERMRIQDGELVQLRAQIATQHEAAIAARQETEERLKERAEQRIRYENLVRVNQVHRSQIELLQKSVLPKEREVQEMQHHITELHDANGEIVVKANMSDRRRVESAVRAKQLKQEVDTAHRQLERVRHALVVLQDELGVLVAKSAVQEKSSLIGEITRIHKRIARQWDALQGNDTEGREEITAELHRQNRFLLQHKHHLRREMDLARRDKHKLVAALSYQNAALMTELNAARKQNTELERCVKRHESFSRASGGASKRIGDNNRRQQDNNDNNFKQDDVAAMSPGKDRTEVGELDGRGVSNAVRAPTAAFDPQSSNLLISRRGVTVRPKSAAAAGTPLGRRPSSAFR